MCLTFWVAHLNFLNLLLLLRLFKLLFNFFLLLFATVLVFISSDRVQLLKESRSLFFIDIRKLLRWCNLTQTLLSWIKCRSCSSEAITCSHIRTAGPDDFLLVLVFIFIICCFLYLSNATRYLLGRLRKIWFRHWDRNWCLAVVLLNLINSCSLQCLPVFI